MVVRQVAGVQQVGIAQDLFRGSGCSILRVRSKHINSRGEEFRDTQIMSGRNGSFAGLLPDPQFSAPEARISRAGSFPPGPVQAEGVQMRLPPKRRERRVEHLHPGKPIPPGAGMHDSAPHHPAFARSEACRMP